MNIDSEARNSPKNPAEDVIINTRWYYRRGVTWNTTFWWCPEQNEEIIKKMTKNQLHQFITSIPAETEFFGRDTEGGEDYDAEDDE